jgi:DNA-binding CsgD family transcriptional regulator
MISEKTVTTHLNHIFEKLGVGSRLQAALLYNNQLKGSV